MSTGVERPSAEAFGERVVQIINDGALALMVAVGHRTALFDAMASMPPAGGAAIARAANLSQQYVREWLGAAGFGKVTVESLPHDPISDYYVCVVEQRRS